MAGEVTGKLCEAATVLACRLGRLADADIHWGVRPTGMSITTDVLIGKDSDAPSAVILVTHSISSMQSHKKFWRNIGELVEVKCHLKVAPLAISIVFGDAQMLRLALITTSCMDLTLRVADVTDGGTLMKELRLLSRLSKGLGKKDTLDLLGDKLTATSKTVLKSLGNQIKNCISARKSRLSALWALVRSSSRDTTRAPIKSSLTRGSAKYLIFDRDTQKRLYEAAKARRALKDDAPGLATQLGFVGGLQKRFVADRDMVQFARDYSLDDLMYLNDSAPLEALQRIAIQPLQGIVNIPAYTDYISRFHAVLSTRKGMLLAMTTCHMDPLSLCSLATPVQNVWLVDFIMSIAKARRGGHNTFGQSQLAEEAGVDSGISSSGYRVFADWLNRREKGVVTDSVLGSVAEALANELALASPATIKELGVKIHEAYVRTYLEIKLLTYENYDPIGYLIRRELDRRGTDFIEESRLPSVFGEIGETTGATSSVLITSCGDAYYWNAATDAGRDHKRKELEGRCVGIKWHRVPSGSIFKARASIKRMILVVDGVWEDTDFRFLYKSGWDVIIYPSELPAFLSSAGQQGD